MVFPVLLLAGLTACRATPEPRWESYAMPPPETRWADATVRVEPDLAAGSTLTIDRAAAIALARHPEIARSQAALDAANARIGQALAAYFPQFSFSTSATRGTGNASGETGHGWDDADGSYRAGIGVSQLIYDFGATDAGHRRAEFLRDAAAADAAAKAIEIVVTVRNAYLTLLAEEALLGVAEQTVENFRRHAQEAETLHEIGRRTRADVAKARVDLGEAELEAVRGRNRVAVARLTLNRSMGLEEDPGYAISAETPELHLDILRDDAARQARLARPELQSAWRRLRAAEQSVYRAHAGHFPTLRFGASLDAGGGEFPLPVNWSLGPSLSWDLVSGGRVTHEVMEAQAALRSARADLAIAEQTVFFESQQAWLEHQESAERMRVAATTEASALESVELISGRYRVGRAALLEQTDAELALARARAESIRARYDYTRSAARLLSAMGLLQPGDRQP